MLSLKQRGKYMINFIKKDLELLLTYVVGTFNKEQFYLVCEPCYDKKGNLNKITLGLITYEIKHLLDSENCNIFNIPRIDDITIKTIAKFKRDKNAIHLNGDEISFLRAESLKTLVDELLKEIKEVYNI